MSVVFAQDLRRTKCGWEHSGKKPVPAQKGLSVIWQRDLGYAEALSVFCWEDHSVITRGLIFILGDPVCIFILSCSLVSMHAHTHTFP